MWSFFFLLRHVRVSDRDTDLVSLGVAACCVTLLHPHFLFVVAVVYTAACRVRVVTRPTGSDSKSQLLLLLYLKKLRCEGTSVATRNKYFCELKTGVLVQKPRVCACVTVTKRAANDNDSCRYHCPDLHLIMTPSNSGVEGGV